MLKGKFEVVRRDQSSGHKRTQTVIALPWRRPAELYARFREAITPKPYVFYFVKETGLSSGPEA